MVGDNIYKVSRQGSLSLFMNQSAKVSFIVPVYNRPKELKVALASCMAQTYETWEAVVVDDHSNEANITEIVGSLCDSRIRYVKQYADKKGEAAARETAIEKASTDIFITLDSDDINHPHRASRCFEVLNIDTPRLLYTRVHHFSEDNPSGKKKQIFQPFNSALFEMINFITNPGTAFNRKAYEAAGSYYNKSLALATDYDQFLRMARANVSIIGLDEIHVSYRKHSGAVTSGATDALHEAIMQVRVQNKVTPFSIDAIKSHALPELTKIILNSKKETALWKDDRWVANEG